MDGMKMKYIAALCMFFDHVGVIFVPDSLVLRIVGRVAMPIFAYMVAVGIRHTADRCKYAIRLLVFATITQFVYIVVLGQYRFNILFGFCLAVLLVDMLELRHYDIWACVVCIIVFVVTDGFWLDYGRLVLYLVIALYRCSTKLSITCVMLIPVLYYVAFDWQLQLCMLLALPVMLLYNGQKGSGDSRILYWFYPCHLLVLGFLGVIL